jgi:CheY-like chemotaxis protein
MNTKDNVATSAPGQVESLFDVTSSGPVDILVVEDDDSQRASIVSALQNSIPDVVILAVRDGPEALDFLFSRDAWIGRVGEDPPRLILLDLALPGSDGFSVLGQIRSIEPQDALTLTPVVIFTDSQSVSDVSESYRCGANSYIIKPLSFPDFQSVVEMVGQYWITHNRAPS